MGIRHLESLVAAAVIVATILAILAPMGASAAGSDWAPATLLYTTNNQVVEPTVTVDQTGGVHVFWAEHLSSPKSGEPNSEIVYTAKRGTGWTTPTDVIAQTNASDPSAAVDEQGQVNLFWHQTSGDLFRSDAAASEADRAASWSPTVDLQGTNNSSQVVADSRGRLHLVYPGRSSQGVLYQYSDDGGATWSFPATVSPADPNSTAEFPRVAVAPDGTIHVVWTEFQLPNGWPPIGVFYSRSSDGGKTWSVPLQIAESGFTQGNIAAGPNGKVFIAWNGMSGVQGRYSRLSTDGGVSWSSASYLKAPMTLTLTTGGSTGTPGLVVDSAGNAHVLFVEDNRVWYSAWQGQGWSEPEYVPSGDEAGLPPPTEPISAKVRHIEQAVMSIGLGNQLQVVFWDVRGNTNQTYVWYTSKAVDAPGLAPKPFTTKVQPTSAGSAVAPALPTSTRPSDNAPEGIASPPAPTLPDARFLTMLSIAPVLAGLGALLGVRLWLARR